MRCSLYILLAAVGAFLPSCRESAPAPSSGFDGVTSAVQAVPLPMASEVAAALEAAGPNRAELERAILDANGDERKATAWLVARSPYRGTVGSVDQHLSKVADCTQLTAGLLRSHVTAAFQAWHEWPWAKEVDSDTFLHYVLPYRMTTEELEDWRAYLLSQEDLVARVKQFADEYAASHDHSLVFRHLLHYLNSEWLATRLKYAPRGMPDLPPARAIAEKTGRCTDLTNALIALCRTFGIAATGVRTIWWPKADSNHYWAGIWDPAGRVWYDVDGASTAACDEAYFHIQHGGCHAKVYRIVPGEERGEVARSMQPREGEALPPLLDWYCRCLPMVDVTKDYTTVSTVTRGGLTPGRLYGLAVFNNNGLQEVSAARARADGLVTFEDVGAKDILYFITSFEQGDNALLQHLNAAPFVLRADGRTTTLATEGKGDEAIVLEGLPADRDLVVRRIDSGNFVDVARGRTDAQGKLAVPHAPKETVLVAFDPKGGPIGRPVVILDRVERF